MDGPFAGAKAGQAVRHRLAGHLGRLPGRRGQRQAGRQPGRERGRVGAAGTVGGGDAMPGDRERAMEAGCTGYIEKPINPETFVAEVEDIAKGGRP